MQILARQEEMDDEDDWNPSKAAGVCLMLLSTLCENDVLEYVSYYFLIIIKLIIILLRSFHSSQLTSQIVIGGIEMLL